MNIELQKIEQIYKRNIEPIIKQYAERHRYLHYEVKSAKINSAKKNKSLSFLHFLCFLVHVLIFVGMIFFANATELHFLVNISLGVLLITGFISFGYIEYFVLTYPIEKAYKNLHFFEKEFKEKVMPIFCLAFDNLSWKSNYNEANILSDSRVIPGVDSCSTVLKYGDVFYGTLAEKEVEIIEVIPEVANNNMVAKNNISDVYIVIKMKYDKNFKEHTLVYPSIYSKPKNLISTQLEDVVFEKEYNIYTTDEVEARYILNPFCMENLNKAKDSLNCQEIACSFYQGNLYISVRYKRKEVRRYSHNQKNIIDGGLFDIGVYEERLNDILYYFQIYNDIKAIQDVIGYFNNA